MPSVIPDLDSSSSDGTDTPADRERIQNAADDETEEEVTNKDEENLTEDEEEEEEEEDESDVEQDTDHPTIAWCGYGKKTPILWFRSDAVVSKPSNIRSVGEKYHMAYKIVKTECKLVRSVLTSHGFHEVHPNSPDFNLMWTGSHLKPYTLRELREFQKINHFPRSYEITRKDRLYKNIQRMQQLKGFRHFDFLPQSFILPGEYQDFNSYFLKDRGSWIVKPIASSRGRGIFLVNHPEQVPLDETLIVSKYVSNPLLIDGFKFDVRLYVAVTSYDPVIIYLYEEGLTRFATVKYDKSAKNIRNQCMHLTNYSVNKKSNDYVRNDDPDVEDYGNKWSLGALLRYLRSQGRDTTALMMRVEDVVIKTIVAAELPIATACKMFMPFRGNCFEVYGFDILIDDNLRPWVLEVNLSPSLACDSPLDLKIKSNMMSDLFSLSGFICQDPMLRKMPVTAKPGKPVNRSQRQRPQSAGSACNQGNKPRSLSGLTSEEFRIARTAREEYQRRGGWVRIFPSPDSWELYSPFLQFTTTHNLMLFQQLFPERAKSMSLKPSSASYTSGASRAKNVYLHSAQYPQLHVTTELDDAIANALQRCLQYERKLSSLGQPNNRRRRYQNLKINQSTTSLQHQNGSGRATLVQGTQEPTRSASYVKIPTSIDTKPAPSTLATAKHHSVNNADNRSSTVSSSSTRETTTNSSTRQTDGKRQTNVTTAQSSVRLSGNDVHRQEMDSKPPPAPTSKSAMAMLHPSAEKRTHPPPPPPPPPPAPSRPIYNVVYLLEKGVMLSKVQARYAFATYLTRVQQRLITETKCLDAEDLASANEQMDLVLRFLKRAAGNLQQPFRVVVPSRKLAVADRRRILAKQLCDFVHVYNKETEQLRQRTEIDRKHLGRNEQNKNLDENKFRQFVESATEAELEDVLTTYTRLHKSASIFLGSNSKTTEAGAQNPSSSKPPHSQSDTTLNRRKEPQPTAKSPDEDLSVVTRPGSESESRIVSHPSRSNSMSSYTGAVLAYSSKLAKSRPQSASSQRAWRNQSRKWSYNSRVRPVSAGARPATSGGSLSHFSSSVDHLNTGATNSLNGFTSVEQQPYDEEAINAALQRLSLRQQNRQYQATPSLSVLSKPLNNPPAEPRPARTSVHTNVFIDAETGSMTQTTKPLAASRPVSAFSNHSKMSVDSKQSQNDYARSGMNSRTANETFESFVDDAVYDSELVAAYNQVTGVMPRNPHYTPTRTSSQYALVEHQRQMLEDSRSLLEQSRAKHQALVAQAHAAHRAYIPKPPPGPSVSRKSVNVHRVNLTR